MNNATCSCSDTNPHVIARRLTADEKIVCLWDDGSLTWALGHAIKGSANPRTEAQRSQALKAGWLVMGDVCIHDAADVSALVAAARWAADRDGLPGTMRGRLADMATPRGPRPVWTILETDATGKATLRVWRLPRMGWPGLAVWHERGRYEIMREIGRSGTYESTGFVAHTLSKIVTLLQGLRSAEVA